MQFSQTPQFGTGLTLARTRLASTVTADVVLDDCRAEAETLVAAGYTAAEVPSPFLEALRGRPEIDATFWQEARAVFARTGIRYLTVHGPNLPSLDTPLPDVIDLMAWHAQVSRDLEAAAMVVHPTSHTHPHVASVLPKLLDRDVAVARVIADVLSSSDTKLALENLPTYGIAYLIQLLKALPQPEVGACFDTGHWNVRPERSLPGVLEALGARVVHLHVSDNNGLCDQHLAPGNGTFDWNALLAHLPAAMKDRPWLIELDPVDPATAEDFDAALVQLDQTRRDAIHDASLTLTRVIDGRDESAFPNSSLTRGYIA